MQTDSQLQQAVIDELECEPSIDCAHIGVTAKNGVVTLIQVKAKASPGDVRERIRSAFQRSSALDAETINVSVDDGTVKLSGQVKGWNEQKPERR